MWESQLISTKLYRNSVFNFKLNSHKFNSASNFRSSAKMSIFGTKFYEIWPKAKSEILLTEFGKKLLKECQTIDIPEKQRVDIEAFKVKSLNFPLEFGTNNCRVMSQPKDRYNNIEKQISSAYPVIHERVLQLYLQFLEHKCCYGYPKEKELYANLSLEDFVQRLLSKRCASFVGRMDAYLLLTGETGSGHTYDTIGTNCEKTPLLLKDCLSYDEVKLSAFLSVSSYTELLNDGNRQNRGKLEVDFSKIEREGVVIGLIGARFQRPFVMEFQDIVISPEQNVGTKGYGQKKDGIPNKSEEGIRQLWQTFYEEPSFLHSDVEKDHKRFGDVSRLRSADIFDNVVMKKRFSISFDTLLIEAQARAFKFNKQAYVHIVGIGLGTWCITEQQTPIFFETFSQRINYLLPKLNNIGALHFSWFGLDEWGDLKHNGFIKSSTHPRGGIITLMANRNPADRLQGTQFEDMLLVISYAWDGNALPGNEFWFKNLAGSNDSSTACSTLISELHNPHINNDWVCSKNLHIASIDHGIIHISDYAKIMV
ncbi:uncharacterized protein LOC131993983 [Stomoxys calcitrans]|uniref:uncharacterized protein LOC131993983 n=1 Tax=Stomoxys calcitrans TaxID=35570 RepID=UPI0027E382FE|nr:uncharacterized protein LOC131993983 [Stomoxys calcitrans]